MALSSQYAITSTISHIGRVWGHLKNIGTTVVYIGDSTVTSGTGYALAAGESIQIKRGGDIYALTASSTSTLAVLNLD